MELGKGGNRIMENIEDLFKYSVERHSEIENLYHHNVINSEGRTKFLRVLHREMIHRTNQMLGACDRLDDDSSSSDNVIEEENIEKEVMKERR
jgi:hypothetical protein